MTKDISQIRSEYKLKQLDKDHLLDDPIEQFKKWLSQAIESKVDEPTAMTLATVDQNNQPSARIVLLKFVNENGFAFFTNYQSNKGKQIEKNPKAAIVFYWGELERQVRVHGIVSKLDKSLSEEYFNSRPERSRISAIISPQSSEVPDRAFLEKKVEEFIKSGKEITRPEEWGGYILSPHQIEFWQGRENRLHDRFLYRKIDQNWTLVRLAP